MKYKSEELCIKYGMPKCRPCLKNNSFERCYIEFFVNDIIITDATDLEIIKYIIEESVYSEITNIISMPYLFKALEINNKEYLILKYNNMKAFL